MNDLNNKDMLYKAYLYEINGIKFTVREIDIISCVVHNRGNKKIAALLSVAYRTVDAHIYNITSKINKNSKDDIIDFAETSGRMPYIRTYYLCLLTESSFNKALLTIAKTLNKTPITLSIREASFFHELPERNEVIKQKLQQLQKDLKLANVILNIDASRSMHYYVLRSNNTETIDSGKEFGLLFDNVITAPTIQEIEYINFTSNQNYCLSVFELLKRIINKPELDNIRDEFQREYKSMVSITDNDPTVVVKQNIKIYNNTKWVKTGLGIFVVSLLSLLIIYYSKMSKSTTSQIQNEVQISRELKVISNRVKEAAEYYNTDQSTVEFAKQNNKNILTLQKDIDYLNKYPKYLYEDDALQSKFNYLACVLSSHYRWNKDIDMIIDEYLSTEHKECTKFFNKEIEKLHQCVSSVILERMIKYYENRYKFTDQDSIKTIKYKLQREHYALEDFILLSYYRARGYFPINSWNTEDLKYVNKYLDFVLLNENPNKSQLFEIFLAKKYKLIIERNHIEAFIKQLDQKLKKEFQEIKDEKNLISTISKIRLNPENVEKLNKIVNLSKNDMHEKLQKLRNINTVFLELLNNGNIYINHYKPWIIDDKKAQMETIIPKENKFNIATICGEIMLTHAIIITYNSILYNTPQNIQTLNIQNRDNLSNSLAIFKEFITNKHIQHHWNDIGINYTKQKIKQAIETIKSADLGDISYNTRLELITSKLLDDKFNHNIINDVTQLSLDIKK